MKKLTPMMAKMRRKRTLTITTFCIAPSVWNRALMISFRLSNFLMTLRGLRALRALKAFRAARLEPTFISVIIKSRVEMNTTKASTLFHPESMYGLTYSPKLLKKNPLAMILMVASIRKHRVKKIFILAINLVLWAFGSFNGLSRGSMALEIRISTRIILSNHLFLLSYVLSSYLSIPLKSSSLS